MGKKEALATSRRASVCTREKDETRVTVLTDFTRDGGRESATGGDEETRTVKTRRALSSSSYFSEIRREIEKRRAPGDGR